MEGQRKKRGREKGGSEERGRKQEEKGKGVREERNRKERENAYQNEHGRGLVQRAS